MTIQQPQPLSTDAERKARQQARPPVEPWHVFHPRFRSGWAQGQHVGLIGPTGSGKTVAARTLARDRQFVVVLGTKMRDPEMDQYIAEGYVRVKEWPPKPRDLRAATYQDKQGLTNVRLVLWPDIKSRADLRAFRPVFAKCLDDCLVKGGWTILADEGLWLMKREGLALGDHLSSIAYTGRSSGVTLMLLLQRPSGVPRDTWANASHLFVWNHGVTNDTREIASLGTSNPKAVAGAVESLTGHQFLYVPCRAGAGWAISQVQL
jgi:hypothetical protein